MADGANGTQTAVVRLVFGMFQDVRQPSYREVTLLDHVIT
jgi:hypothetical protein